MLKGYKSWSRRRNRQKMVLPFIFSAFATLAAGALMALVDRLWDRPLWIDWIHPGAFFAIIGGLSSGIVYILTMVHFDIKERGSLTYPLLVLLSSSVPMLLVWNVYSCNALNLLSGFLTLIGFIVAGFAAIVFIPIVKLRGEGGRSLLE